MLKFNASLNIKKDKVEDKKNSLRTVLMKCMFKMEELALNGAPTDRGEIRQKITLFPQILADKYILKSRAQHSAAMEYGTRPFYAPIEPLKAWAKRNLGDEDIGYAVRAKIAKVGITAQPYMRPALIQVKTYWLNVYLKETK